MPLPTDPFLASQWHLGNIGGLFDLNVRGVWNPVSGAAYTGAGIRVVVIDDGFDYLHSDLVPNYNANLDFDFETNAQNAFGDPAADHHGTPVAGIIGADNDGTGTVGIAFDAELVGYRVDFEQAAFPLMFRDALHHAAVTALGDVVNVSLGFSPGSEFLSGGGADQINTSTATAVSQGRGGLGTTIVKGAGNFRQDNFDLNADITTNDTCQVVVAAVDQDGFVSSYSSYGAALLVSAFGTDFEVVAPDRVGDDGQNNTDYRFFAGTSAATPMVSGVVALMYQANPLLGWRDVQSILAHSARHVGSEIGSGPAFDERYTWDWNAAETWNGGGLHFSNDYGYGLVDGLAAVRLAETWLVGMTAQTSANQISAPLVDMLDGDAVIPAGQTGSDFTGEVTADIEVERIVVGITMATTRIGDVDIYVTAPSGTVSQVMDHTGGDNDFDRGWLFQSQAFRGEQAAGTWSVRVVDVATGDELTVSNILFQAVGRAATDTNDRYVYTNEYSDYANVGGHGTTLSDTNGGADTINASAVSSNSVINLNAGSTSIIDGVATTIAAGTVIEYAFGGDGDDTLVGNAAANSLVGYRGNDTVSYVSSTGAVTVSLATQTVSGGDAAGDVLFQIENATGGLGNDTLTGDGGVNVLSGGPGADTLDGGAATDSLDGGGGDDTYVLGDGADTVTDSTGNDTITSTITRSLASFGAIEKLTLLGTAAINATGNGLANTLTGNSAANTLDGGAATDALDGGAGDDTYVLGDGADTVTDSTGNDTITSTITRSLASFGTIEKLTLLGTAAINATGNAQANTLTGNSAANILDGGANTDALNGGAGDDTYVLGDGTDTVTDSVGIDTITSTITRSLASFGTIEKLTLLGTAAINATGNAHANTLTGNSAANTLDGGLATDNLNGGGGDDTYVLGDGADTVTDSTGNDTITSTITRSLASFGTIEKLTLLGTAAINGTGNGLANTITGNGAANILDGGLGTDTLNGGGGNDTFIINTISDVLQDSAGIDLVKSTVTKTLATGFENLTLLGTLAIQGTGNLAGNVMTGNTGNNKLLGLAGNDTLDGGSGNDILVGGAGKDAMTGGAGADDFDFDVVAEIGKGATRDVITGFVHGTDDIDLSTIDANGAAAGHAFTFLAVNGAAFTAAKGQLRWFQQNPANTINDKTIVEGDIDGNKVADFQIELKGLVGLTAVDFML